MVGVGCVMVFALFVDALYFDINFQIKKDNPNILNSLSPIIKAWWPQNWSIMLFPFVQVKKSTHLCAAVRPFCGSVLSDFHFRFLKKSTDQKVEVGCRNPCPCCILHFFNRFRNRKWPEKSEITRKVGADGAQVVFHFRFYKKAVFKKRKRIAETIANTALCQLYTISACGSNRKMWKLTKTW